MINEQVNAETYREESELKAAFTSFIGSWKIHTKHTACMIEGIKVDTTCTKYHIESSYESCFGYLKEAFAMDLRRIRRKHYIEAFHARETEAYRLTTSNRSSGSIEKALEVLYSKDLNDEIDSNIVDIVDKVQKDHQSKWFIAYIYCQLVLYPYY
jgi:hypothetical protein